MYAHGGSMTPNGYNGSNYSEYSLYNQTLPSQARAFQIGRYIETSDSSDSDDDMDLMPPIDDPFYRKSVDEILDSDSDQEQERFEQLFDTEYGLEQIDGLFEQTLPSNEFID